MEMLDQLGMVLEILKSFMYVFIAIAIFMTVAQWMVYSKAGQPGWAVLIPIYNIIVYMKIINKPWWWMFGILLGIIPFVGAILVLVYAVYVTHLLSTAFGKGAGFTVGLILLPIVFYPILAFGSAQYQNQIPE